SPLPVRTKPSAIGTSTAELPGAPVNGSGERTTLVGRTVVPGEGAREVAVGSTVVPGVVGVSVGLCVVVWVLVSVGETDSLSVGVEDGEVAAQFNQKTLNFFVALLCVALPVVFRPVVVTETLTLT